jgi:hypothetical protein
MALLNFRDGQYQFLFSEYWAPDLGGGQKTLSGLKEINILGKC